MKNNKKLYVSDKLIRNDISFDKKTSIKSLFDLNDSEVKSIENVVLDKKELNDNFVYESIDKDFETNIVIDDLKNDETIKINNINLVNNFAQDVKSSNNNEDSFVNSYSINNNDLDNINFNENNLKDESLDFNYELSSNINEPIEFNSLEENDQKGKTKSRKSKILPWMLAGTSLLLAGTTTATIVLSVLPNDSISQSQSNAIDKNVNFELKHDRSKLVNNTNTTLQNNLKNINIDMDNYFFGLSLLNKDNFKFNSKEKNELILKLNSMFSANKIEFINNVVDVIVLNNKNSIASNYYGINSIYNSDSWQKNVEISSYKASDIFLINGVYQMEFSMNIVSNENSLLKNSNNEKKFLIKFNESTDINQKSYIEITNKTDSKNPIIEIKEIVDIYSEYLLLNEYYNRNNDKSYLSINPFTSENKNIFNNSELSNVLKKYNEYIDANYFYQFIKNKSLSLNNFDIKDIFDINKSLIDTNIVNNVNELSSLILKNSNEVKNIFTFLGIEDLLKSNRSISSIKVNDIKLSNFVATSGNSNKVSGSLFTNITYKTNSNIESNYYSYIFVEPQVINENLSLKYSVTSSENGKKFGNFVKKDWNIKWTPIEILLQKEIVKNNENENVKWLDLKNDINKIAKTADDPSFDTAKDALISSGFDRYVIPNSTNPNILEFIESGIQYNVAIKTWLFDVPSNEGIASNQEGKNAAFEKRIRTYWIYYFLDEINSIDEELGQSQKSLDAKPFNENNPFIKNVNIDLLEWTGLLTDKSNKNLLNYELKIRYSYINKEKKKIIVNKVVSVSDDSFYNQNNLKHYMPTTTIIENTSVDNQISNKLVFNQKMNIAKNIDSFMIKSTKRFK